MASQPTQAKKPGGDRNQVLKQNEKKGKKDRKKGIDILRNGSHEKTAARCPMIVSRDWEATAKGGLLLTEGRNLWD